jgi:hypothetical protein
VVVDEDDAHAAAGGGQLTHEVLPSGGARQPVAWPVAYAQCYAHSAMRRRSGCPARADCGPRASRRRCVRALASSPGQNAPAGMAHGSKPCPSSAILSSNVLDIPYISVPVLLLPVPLPVPLPLPLRFPALCLRVRVRRCTPIARA